MRFYIGDEVVVILGAFKGTTGIVTDIRRSSFSLDDIIRFNVKVFVGEDTYPRDSIGLYSYKLRKVKSKKIRKVAAWK